MPNELASENREKIISYLRTVAPFSVIERGIEYASSNLVLDCARTGMEVRGSVKVDNEDMQSCCLRVLSASRIESSCSCSSVEEMQEQWCAHATALFWRAYELGFFEERSGFAESESTYRMNTTSPQDIAATISELCTSHLISTPEASILPKVRLVLDASTDRLGVAVIFDEEVQTPALFEGFRKGSSRALDNVVLQQLEELGTWDEQRALWFINSSHGIETILGLVQEYENVWVRSSGSEEKRLSFATRQAEACIEIEWHTDSAQLSMAWLLADGKHIAKTQELLGTGPYWVVIDNAMYKLSRSAARIASIFPYSSSITLSRGQLGPLVEVLTSGLPQSELVRTLNPDAQPGHEIVAPGAMLRLERSDNPEDHFRSRQVVEILALLEFEYPEPPAEANLVYLPHRECERECHDTMRALGFEFSATRKKYVMRGDQALDLLHGGRKVFPEGWHLQGLESLQKELRFVELSLNVSVSSHDSSSDDKEVSKTKRSSNLLNQEANEDAEELAEDTTPRPIDWFDCSISLTQNNANVPLSTIFKNARSDDERWVRLDSGAYARVPGGTIQQLKTTLGMLDSNFRLSNTIKTRLSTAQALGLTVLGDDQLQVTTDQHLKRIARKLADFESITLISPTKNFSGDLRSYQQQGLSWMNFLREIEFGGILADEMGLGKTVQALALLQYLKDNATKRAPFAPCLVVAPTSVITNWIREAQRFTPGLRTLLLHGPQRKKLFAQIPDHDIIVTSYALLRMDRYDYEKFGFSYLILDEAQNIKNPDAATTKAAKALRAKHRLALSGTPTENRPLELWSIMDFLMPGYLGSYEFFRTYLERPILESGPDVRAARFLNQKVKPFILRRRKADVEKQLPPKTETTLYVEMTDSQRQLYAQILEEVRPKVFDAVNQKGLRGATISILAALLRLRQVCNHPLSIDSLKHLTGFDSGKFNALKEITLEAIESGRKILLFSQFREMLSIIRGWLNEANINYLYLDGATRHRQELIDRFNLDQEVRLFLISLKAGGTGLNLTAADTVIIYDPWWNPAVEGQAVDRAHRIGQQKSVSVYRLVTENSVEQKIMELKARKAKIVDALLNDEDGVNALNLSKNDLESLFSTFPTE